jgi:hypothetical protein
METYFTRLDTLSRNLEGDLKHDKITTTIYSTDASVYKEEPAAVAWPKTYRISGKYYNLLFRRNQV